MLGHMPGERKLRSVEEFTSMVSTQWQASLVRSARAFVSGGRSRSRSRSRSRGRSRDRRGKHSRNHHKSRKTSRHNRSRSSSSDGSRRGRSPSYNRRSHSESRSDSSNDNRYSSQQYARALDLDAGWHKAEFRVLVGSTVFNKAEALAKKGDRSTLYKLLFKPALTGKTDTTRNLFLRAFKSDFYRKRKKEGDLRKRIRHCMTSVRSLCGAFVKFNMDLRGDSTVDLPIQTLAWHSIRSLNAPQFLDNIHMFGKYSSVRELRVGTMQKDAYMKCVKNGLKACKDLWSCLVSETDLLIIYY